MEDEQDLLFTKDHEWIRLEGKIATMGISDYAQSSLGDITFIELPQEDDEVDQFGEIAAIESVKAANDIFSPISGKIVEVNTALEENPGTINKSCYEKGWIAKIEISDSEEQSNLMTPEEYQHFLES